VATLLFGVIVVAKGSVCSFWRLELEFVLEALLLLLLVFVIMLLLLGVGRQWLSKAVEP
jgi:hypothetical protein